MERRPRGGRQPGPRGRRRSEVGTEGGGRQEVGGGRFRGVPGEQKLNKDLASIFKVYLRLAACPLPSS